MTPKARRLPRLKHLGHWLAELLLVFVGVYAAFWLNDYQHHIQDMQRRDQILAALEQRLQQSIASGKAAGAEEDSTAATFEHALDTGRMPALHPFVFNSDYDPSDIATLLRSGGIQLLDVRTLTALRQVESVIRWGLNDMAHYERLSDELIVPNLGRPRSFFYDVATKRLRPRFEIYPQALEATAKFAHDLEQAQTQLLRRIEIERQRQ